MKRPHLLASEPLYDRVQINPPFLLAHRHTNNRSFDAPASPAVSFQSQDYTLIGTYPTSTDFKKGSSLSYLEHAFARFFSIIMHFPQLCSKDMRYHKILQVRLCTISCSAYTPSSF